MDLFPLYNSLRIAVLSTCISFFLGLFLAHRISKMSRLTKGCFDLVLTLPLVLPPTVIGFFILKLLGPNQAIGRWIETRFATRLIMNWTAAVWATVVVSFPLTYRSVRGAFESFDVNLRYVGQTLGHSNSKIFWCIQVPTCKQGILAGSVLSFARALGEYGATSMVAGYTPGKTATISTSVYQFWRIGDDASAYRWVLVNIAISAIALFCLNLLESKSRDTQRRAGRETC